jgi:GNAT superfamily N-acetyltransferase
VLAELELLAGKFGYQALRLETGIRQPEAIALYTIFGFKPIPCFGKYAEIPISRCFEKRISDTPR